MQNSAEDGLNRPDLTQVEVTPGVCVAARPSRHRSDDRPSGQALVKRDLHGAPGQTDSRAALQIRQLDDDALSLILTDNVHALPVLDSADGRRARAAEPRRE